VEPDDASATLNEMETPQNDEDNGAGEDPLVPVDPASETPPVVVNSPGATAPPVMLECSQCARAPPSYLKDFFCDSVDRSPAVIAREVWRDQQLRVVCPSLLV